uniref:PPM-type phosphatase domain-containing protein n=1 Tax=Amphimedon queenslandica TaxID=400682 RepID=A0A1X7V6D0_AMPQE
MFDKYKSWSPNDHSHSTAEMTVSLLFIKGSQVFVANVGDSDIVMAIENEKYGQH